MAGIGTAGHGKSFTDICEDLENALEIDLAAGQKDMFTKPKVVTVGAWKGKELEGLEDFLINKGFSQLESLDMQKTREDAAWELIQTTGKIGVADQKKLLVLLHEFGATGRPDIYIHRKKKKSTLIDIDIKCTAKENSNPSAHHALQLLLYQWMAARMFQENEGADMYLLRCVEKFKERKMQLLKFDPPDYMQYHYDRVDPCCSYKGIVNEFAFHYYYDLWEKADESQHPILLEFCKICEDCIQTDSKNREMYAVKCHGECNGFIHRRCAGLSWDEFDEERAEDYQCRKCELKEMEDVVGHSD